MRFDWAYFWQSLLTPSPRFLEGLALTVVISVASMISALIVGLFIALMGRSRFIGFRIFASFYIWLIHGTSHVAHADRGTSMTSKTVAALLSDLEVTKSHSRPRVK